MTDLAEHSLGQGLEEPTAPPHAEEGRIAEAADAASAQAGAPLFAELVWAHHRWERERSRRDDPDAALERAYLAKLAEFQKAEGRLEQVYWSTRGASAVAMTVMPGKRGVLDRLRLRERDDVVRLHRLSDWVTRDSPHIADLLEECDLLGIRVAEVLRGSTEAIAARWILGIEAHLLGFFERTSSLPDEEAELELVRGQRKKLATIEAYYHRAASKTGRIVVVTGMLMGVGLAAVVAALAGLLLWVAGMDGSQLRLVLLSYGAGALGALVSAMSRMGKPERGRFNIDFELGRPLLRRLGVFRPFVGAVIGIALYFLLASGVLQISLKPSNEPYYYGFAAFLAGFSERFATVVFGAAEHRFGAGEDRERPERAAESQSAPS